MGKKWFIRIEFPASIFISNVKYNHLKLQHKNSFYLFKNELDYAFDHFFAEFKSIKSNVNKVLSDPLMIVLIKKLPYKNADEWIQKLLEISWDISKNK